MPVWLFAPTFLKWLAITLVVAGLVVLVYGRYEAFKRKHYELGYAAMKVKHEAYVAEVAAKALEAERAAREKEKADGDVVRKADATWDKTVRSGSDAARAKREWLRDSATPGRSRVPVAPAPADSCPVCPRCATKAELLAVGERLIGIAEDADRERAGLMACATAWPH